MELDDVLKGIKGKEAAQIRQIKSETDQRVSEINRKARLEAEKQKERILADGNVRLRRDQAIIEQRAEMQALQIHADARQTLIEGVVNEVKERISHFRQDNGYENILRQLIHETLNAISPSLLMNQKIILHLDERDQEIAEEIKKTLSDPVDFVYDLKCDGGCIGETDDQQVVVKNSFESRFERAEADIQQYLSLYFEKKTSPS